jgi:hypothetical protein
MSMYQATDHWVVCCGTRVVAGLLESKDEAVAEARRAIQEGCSPVSIHHVGEKAAQYPAAPVGSAFDPIAGYEKVGPC